MRIHEEVTVTRDVEAVVVPAGDVILIPEGVTVTITQALGGSFTVLTPHGYMARVSGADADALGKEPPAAAEAPPGSAGPPADAGAIEKAVWEELRLVYDPEIPVNIVDLGLVYGCTVTPGEGGAHVEVQMTMTAPGCGMGDVLAREAEDRIKGVSGVASAHTEIVWDPPWDQSRMSEAARLELGFG
jgi:probable FeS assembly SUF system protein SufT